LTHYEIANEALQQGKHLFLEKPMAMTLADAVELATKADEEERTLMIDHTYEYEPAIRHLKTIVGAGDLGSIEYIHAERLNFGRVRTDTNVLWSLGPQDVSILNYVLEAKPEAVAATGVARLTPGIADVVQLRLFYSGIEAHVHLSWWDPVCTRRLTVIGSDKMAMFDQASPGKLAIFHKQAVRTGEAIQLVDEGSERPELISVEPLAAAAEEFVRACREGRRPLSDGWSGTAVVATLAAAEDSLRAGGAMRPVPVVTSVAVAEA
jgi:predicted dehydrogenase